MPRRGTILLACGLICGLATAAATGAPATATAPAASSRPTTRPDPHLWTKRNVELIRDAAQSGEGIDSAVMFSVAFNPLIVREPYAAQTLEIVEAALASPRRKDPEEMTGALGEAAQLLRQPEDQRVLRQLLGETSRPDKPLVRAASNKMSELSPARLAEPYPTLIDRLIEQVDAHARQAGDWGRLALGYHHLAYDALEANRPQKADIYIDRMLAILREHPEFQDPYRGNTNNVSADGLAALLIKAGRADDLANLERALQGQPKIDLLIGIVGGHAREGRLDQARQVVEKQLRPLAPDPADRLAAALAGKVPRMPAPRTVTTAATTSAVPRRAATRPDPAELRLREVLSAVAHAHAARGAIDAASAQLIALQADRLYNPAGRDALASHEWARLAKLAADGGHPDAARAAFERALDALSKDPIVNPVEFQDKASFVREALALGDFKLANDMLQTSSMPGDWGRYRLARAHRRRGNRARAEELIDEGLAIARKEDGGHMIAALAVDWHRAGDVKRAEALLFEAMNHLDGEGFGMGVTGAVVSAAMKMNRLDLLERVYEKPERSHKLLLCIIASRAGTFVVDERHDDDDDD